jgi:hypothetical protein
VPVWGEAPQADPCRDRRKLTSARSKNFDDVKRLMAQQARETGGNAVVDFKYGPKSAGFWRSLIDCDDVHWCWEGKIAFVP